MAKKSKKSAIFAVAALFGIIAIALYFIPMMKYYAEINILGATANNKVNFSGFNLVFGAKEIVGETYNNITKTTTDYSLGFEVKAAIGPMIAGICTIVGIIAAILTAAVGKGKKTIVKFIAFAAFAAAAILTIVITKSTFISANEIGNAMADSYSLAIGAYLVCGSNGVAALASLAA